MKRKTKKYLRFGILLLVVLGGFLVIRAAINSGRVTDETDAGEESRSGLKVIVAPITEGSLRQSVWVTGEVRSFQEVDVTSKLSGRLNRMRREDGLKIDEGVELEAGKVVAMIDDNQYQATVRSAEAALAVAESGRGLAQVNLTEANRESERWVKLRAGGSGSEQQLDQAVTDVQRAEAELTAAEARIVQSRAALEQARVDLAETVIEVPFSGVVTRKYVDEGAFVGPSTPLFRLADISRVEIIGGVADRHYPQLHIGQTRAEIEVDAYPEEIFLGKISRLRPELDKVTRTVAVTIQSDNANRHLKPGMYARLRLILQERDNVPLVADEALLVSDGGQKVFVVEDGLARVREVRIGMEEGNLNEVLEGLVVGEQVVVRGHRLLRDGMAVDAGEGVER